MEHKRSSRLREILIMIVRMLLILFLITAFAQPYVPADERQFSVGNQTVVCIYLDNSFSMQAPGSQGTLLDMAKTEVRNILRGYGPQVKVCLMTNGWERDDQNLYLPDQVEVKLPEIGFDAHSRTFAQVCARQDALLRAFGVTPGCDVRYFISDFQRTGFRLPVPDWNGDSLSRYVFVPVQPSEFSNLSIDSVTIDRPVVKAGDPVQLTAFLRSHTQSELLQIPLRLFVNGRQAGAYSVDFASENVKKVQFPMFFKNAGMYSCYIEIADFPVDFDNRLYFSVNVVEDLEIMQIGDKVADGSFPRPAGENLWIRTLFAEDSTFYYRWVGRENIDYENLFSQRLLVFNDRPGISLALAYELKKYVEQGGALLLLPPCPDEKTGLDRLGRNTLFERVSGYGYGDWVDQEEKVEELFWSDPLFANAIDDMGRNVRLPSVKGYYPLPGDISFFPSENRQRESFPAAGTHEQEEDTSGLTMVYSALMRLGNGKDFLSEYTVGKGRLFVLSTPLDEKYTDFHRNFSFVVSVLNMALLSGESPRLYYVLGEDDVFFLPRRIFSQKEGTCHIYSYDLVSNGLRKENVSGKNTSIVASGTVGSHIPEGSANTDILPRVERIGWELGFYTYGQIDEEGNYLVGVDGDRGRNSSDYQALYPFSFNIDRNESRQDYVLSEELQEWVKSREESGFYLMDPENLDLAESAAHFNKGTELWKVFIIFALVFAFLEILLLRGILLPEKSLRPINKKE